MVSLGYRFQASSCQNLNCQVSDLHASICFVIAQRHGMVLVQIKIERMKYEKLYIPDDSSAMS